MRTVSIEELRPKPKPQLKRPGTAKPKPQEVKVEVKQAEGVAPVVNIDMNKFSEDNTAALKLLVDAIKAQPGSPTAESPKEWEFTVKRDGNNLIHTITAKAK
jgi:hypothetical protein